MKRTLFDDIISDMFVPLSTSRFVQSSIITPEEQIIEKIKSLSNLEQTDREGRTLLINAAFYSRLKVLKYLISEGANINAMDTQSFTALHASVMSNNYEAVRMLIDAGVDVKAKNAFGNNALFVATSQTDLAIIQLLVENGVDPDEKNNYGVSPRDKFARRPEIMAAMRSRE